MRVYKKHFLGETKVSTILRRTKRGQATFLVGVILCSSKRCQISAQKMPEVSLFQDKVACPLFILGAGMAFFVDFQELS